MFSDPVADMSYSPTVAHAAQGDFGFLKSVGRMNNGGNTTVVNIRVDGALDARAVAEQIRGVLRDDARTRGLATAGVSSWR